MKKTFIAISLALFSCLILAACTANATSTQEIPSNSGKNQPVSTNIGQDTSDAVADEKELSQELLKFLEKEGEERRNFYVASVESTGEKDYKAVLDFSTKRSDGKNITVTFEDGTYTFSLK